MLQLRWGLRYLTQKSLAKRLSPFKSSDSQFERLCTRSVSATQAQEGPDTQVQRVGLRATPTYNAFWGRNAQNKSMHPWAHPCAPRCIAGPEAQLGLFPNHSTTPPSALRHGKYSRNHLGILIQSTPLCLPTQPCGSSSPR